jgi:hypothetical protein
MVVRREECMQSDAMVAKRAAQQAPEMVAILRIEEVRTLVDASLRDVQWRTRQFESQESCHGHVPFFPHKKANPAETGFASDAER